MTDTSNNLRTMSVPSGMVATECIDELKADAKTHCPELFSHVWSLVEDPFLQKIVDVESSRMAFDRVCILGDAAFASRPHAASGSAKAADDAWTLAQALQENNFDVTVALSDWGQARVEVGKALVEASRDTGIRYQATGDWSPESNTGGPRLHKRVG